MARANVGAITGRTNRFRTGPTTRWTIAFATSKHSWRRRHRLTSWGTPTARSSVCLLPCGTSGGCVVSMKEIEQAPFLAAEQKRDILYHKAVRFLVSNRTRAGRGQRRNSRGSFEVCHSLRLGDHAAARYRRRFSLASSWWRPEPRRRRLRPGACGIQRDDR